MTMTTRLQNTQHAKMRSGVTRAAIVGAPAPRCSSPGCCDAMSHATMDGQALLPRKSLHNVEQNQERRLSHGKSDGKAEIGFHEFTYQRGVADHGNN